MKKILLLSTFLIFACSGGDDKNSLTELNLKGKVESVYTTSFTATEKFGEVTKDDWEENEKQKFDDKGNEIESVSYVKWVVRKGKGLRWNWKYKYDDKGNRIESATYDVYGELMGKSKFKYDDKGNQIEWAYYDKDGELDYTEIYELEYDSKGNWIKKITYKDDKPTFISEREIEYYN